MHMDAEGESPQILAQRLIDRCRADIQAAWDQLEAAWRSLGRVPKALVERGAVPTRPSMTPKRQPRSLTKTSPLRTKKARAMPRPSLPKLDRFPKPEGRL
jgi:hypothetical protein